MQSNDSPPFDLTKYSLEAGNVFPYFELKQKDSDFFIYEGATGKDRFMFYKVPGDSSAGEMCREYLDLISDYEVQGRNEENVKLIVNAFNSLIDACDKDATEARAGADAWLSYWNDCCKDIKGVTHFAVIHHLEALKEWYILKLRSNLQQLEEDVNRSLTQIERSTLLKRFKNEIAEEVKQFLLNGTTDYQSQFRHITISHASELITFYNWLVQHDMDEEKLKHRHHAIIRKYKIDAKYQPNVFDRRGITEKFGKKREQAIDSVNEHSATYKEITAKELISIIPFLEDFPNAKRAAENDLAKLM